VLYHLRERAIEHAVIPWCERNNVAVVAYSPFGHNNFPSPQSSEGRLLAEIGKKHDANPYQVALAFLTRRPSVFAIPKAASEAHVAQNAAAGDLVLTLEELAKLDQAFPLGRSPHSLPML
jgi:diketogulonate reductase-like aldo/keto reductase